MSRSVWSACSLLPLSPVQTARKLRNRPKAAASCTHSIRFATFGRAKHIPQLQLGVPQFENRETVFNGFPSQTRLNARSFVRGGGGGRRGICRATPQGVSPHPH